jgi:hypothetical protein
VYEENHGVLRATGTDPEGLPLSYAWDLDGNGSFETPGASVRFSAGGLDGPGRHTVTVKATDPGGLSATASASVAIVNQRPDAVFAVSPTTVDEGGTVTISLSGAADPSVADMAAGFTYYLWWENATGRWDVAANGLLPAGGSTSATCTSVESRTHPDSLAHKGKVIDKDGRSSSIFAQRVTVRNLPPALTIAKSTAGAGFRPTAPVELSASFADPGVTDTHTCTIAWGDGATTAGTVTETGGKGTCTGSHAYTASGNRTIQVMVRDDEGAEGSATVGITITGP